jgi:Envelope integrity protein A
MAREVGGRGRSSLLVGLAAPDVAPLADDVSLGFDFGGDGARTMMLVYDLPATDAIYQRFVGIESVTLRSVHRPNSALNSIEVAEVLATALHTRFLAPKIDGLGTIDGGHLNSRSAELWSTAFLEALTPIVTECLGLDGAPPPSARTAGQG